MRGPGAVTAATPQVPAANLFLRGSEHGPQPCGIYSCSSRRPRAPERPSSQLFAPVVVNALMLLGALLIAIRSRSDGELKRGTAGRKVIALDAGTRCMGASGTKAAPTSPLPFAVACSPAILDISGDPHLEVLAARWPLPQAAAAGPLWLLPRRRYHAGRQPSQWRHSSCSCGSAASSGGSGRRHWSPQLASASGRPQKRSSASRKRVPAAAEPPSR